MIEIEINGQLKTFNDEESFNSFLKINRLSVDDDGNIFQTLNKGIIPEILQKWFNDRKEMRKKAAECKKKGDTNGYNFYNLRQQVQKILLNSVYGCLGLPIFRWYDVDNAEGVTTTGVSIIKTTAKAINSYYKQQLGVDGDYVIYTDTDSCFVDAIPIIKKRFPNIDFKNDTAMTDAIMEVTTEVQTYVNSFYDIMAERFFNLTGKHFKLERNKQLVETSHTLEAKQEVISKTSFWLAKKRYAQWIIHKEGHLLDKPELEVKGFDVVRTSFPAAFRKFMESFLIKFLTDVPKEQLDADILAFKEQMKTLPVFDIAKNTSVKFVSGNGKENYNPENRKPFQIINGSNAQVKASLMYNDLLNKWGLNSTTEPIFHGQKIKWVYLQDNPFGIEALAMKADGNDPDKILDFINKYVDRNKMFEKELKSKISHNNGTGIYDVMKWEFPNTSMKTAAKFFDF